MLKAISLNGARSLNRLGAAQANITSATYSWRARAAIPSLQTLHPPFQPISSDEDEKKSRRRRHQRAIVVRPYHSTVPSERGAAVVLSLGAATALAKAGQLTVRAYKEWKESQPTAEEEAKIVEEAKRAEEAESGQAQAKDQSEAQAKEKQKANGKEEKRENIFAKFFDLGVGAKYYEGGFEDKMNRREAALILGVRESSTPKRIKEAHRKLLILNHPDTGGSTYISGKTNEAKELLLKGRKE